MGIQLLETNHKAYGRVLVNEEGLQTADPFIQVRLLNPPSTIKDMSLLTVGKAALKDQGGYVQPEGRNDRTRVEQYLPLVYKAVSVLMRTDDDWDELFCIGSLALVEADRRFDDKRNNGFAAFAKAWIMGEIKKSMDPTRNGTMNMVEMHEEHFNIAGEDNSVSEVMDVMLTTLEEMTKAQREIMMGLYVTGHSMSNMAKITNSTKQNVMYHRDRALKVIRRKLNGV
jgi:RNA polymerase sigma factor (sigma-70 family)